MPRRPTRFPVLPLWSWHGVSQPAHAARRIGQDGGGDAVTVRLENARSRRPVLEREFQAYQALAGTGGRPARAWASRRPLLRVVHAVFLRAAGFPAARWFGREGNYHALVVVRPAPPLALLARLFLPAP
jgi:hypothetical protein